MRASREISEGFSDIDITKRYQFKRKRRVLTCKTAFEFEFEFLRGRETEKGFVASA